MRKKLTFTLRRIGSSVIISINGGLVRGVPVVISSPSTGFPCTLTASQRLIVEEREKFIAEKVGGRRILSEQIGGLRERNANLEALVMIDARSKRNPSTCISITQYLFQHASAFIL